LNKEAFLLPNIDAENNRLVWVANILQPLTM